MVEPCFLARGDTVDKGQFCFLKDQYYMKFTDKYLMKNKETIAGVEHNRPFFFVFPDVSVPGIYWLVPVSSRCDKYKTEYDKKVERYGFCNTIRFGTILGTQAAFLIQNMCPVTEEYISKIYKDKNNMPIKIDNRILQDVIYNARKVLDRHLRGVPLIFPDVKTIYNTLCAELESQKTEPIKNTDKKPSLLGKIKHYKSKIAKQKRQYRQKNISKNKNTPEK